MRRLHKHQIDRFLNRVDGELDLHGLTRREAGPELERFLDEAERLGWQTVRIIVGKGWNSPDGKGVLRQFVGERLDEHGYRYTTAKINEGGEGAYNVTLS